MKDDHLQKLRAEQSKYHEALGRFVTHWAGIEQLLYYVLLHYADMSPGIGESMLSGVRAKLMMDNILRVVECVSASKARKDDLRFLFTQLTAILTMRDRLMHYGNSLFSIQFANEEFVEAEQHLTNVLRLPPDKVFRHKVTTRMIDAMTTDVDRGVMGLKQHLTKRGGKRFKPWEHSGDASTWLYKSPQPIRTKA